ncbi:MAG TPA: DUF2934 domain-containing protein [Candidatus Sulfotelmatobacter sp.]|nr:DUF2934 domain-containing protein [Candidatus Sulfotelmatobacter sp.]
MKQIKFPKNQEPGGTAPPAATADLNQNEASSKPSPDEVAKRAYSRYVDQGSLHGHDKQHWLEAEAQLVAERALARVYVFS